MDQDHRGENGPKDGSASHKPSSTGKTAKGRAGGSMGPGLAIKIPGKQPPKVLPIPKKGRPTKSVQNLSATTPDLLNGNGSHLKVNREGRRPGKDEKMANHLSPSLGRKSKSQNSSRNNSPSPTNRMDSGDASKKVPSKSVELSDNEVSSQNLKQLLSIGNPSRIVYSRIQLLNISENPSSRNRPDCLEKDFNTTNGRWDPETWHRSLSSPPPTTPGEKVQKFAIPESRDRFADDSSTSGLILGPQRRSFQDGCHVTSTTASRLSKHHLASPTDTSRHGRPRLVLRQRSEADYDSSPALNRDRQIESASAMRSEEFDWERRGDNSRFRERDLSDLRPRDRGPRELPHESRSDYGREHRENDYRDRDFRERKFSHSRDYGNSGWFQSQSREPRERRYSNNEPEPEWYTDGPTSQSETMDLAGFEDETPAAAADFSSWGGEIPMDDIGPSGKQSEPKKEQKDELEENNDSVELEKTKQEQKPDDSKDPEKSEDHGSEDSVAAADASGKGEEAAANETELPELDFNELLGTAGFSAVMEQILKENSGHVPNASTDKTSGEGLPHSGSASRFSQWFQKDQGIKNESGSGVSTPHEELENLAEVAAERGLASPADLGSKVTQQPPKPDIMHLLTQGKLPGNLSPSLKPEAMDQQEVMRELLRQQMKKGSVMNAAELEAKAGARRSPHAYGGGVDMQNTDAFNKLVASIKEKDKIRQRQQLLAQQQAVLNQYQGKPGMNLPGGRVPSPDELAAHTQNIFQQALIKRQLERQKEAYSEKIRQIEQQRREEQLREAIRSADAKMQESKQRNKSLAFMPTSVMRKMQESRNGKTEDELMGIQQQQMMPGEVEDIASATASFSVKLANSGKKLPPGGDLMSQHKNNLLSRIYQSAGAQQPKRSDNPGLRRNASFPEVLMDSNKLARTSAFHQPMRQNVAASSMDFSKLSISSEADTTARLRNLLSMPNEMQSANLLNKQPGKAAMADVYNNNLLKVENQSGKFDRSSPSTEQLDKRAHAADAELKNQHEVALLTHCVLKKYGISEDQLSRLTPQEQQVVVNTVQEQYFHLQAEKRRLREKKAKEDSLRLEQGDLSSSLAVKNDFQVAMADRNAGKLDQKDPRTTPNSMPLNPATAAHAQAPGSMRAKYPLQRAPPLHGVPPAGLLPTANPQLHPLQLRSLMAPHMQFIPPPMARGAPMLPTAFLPQQTHIPGRLMPPPPPNMPLASPLGAPYPAAALMQMQLYQQQQRAILTAAAIQQQQQMVHQQAIAAARQHQLGAANLRGDFSNPLERWFGREVLSQSQLPVVQKTNGLTLNDIERGNNQKQE